MLNIFRQQVGAKIILGYLASVSLMVVVGVLVAGSLTQVTETVNDLTNNQAVQLDLSNGMVEQIALARLYANRYIQHQNQPDLDAFRASFKQLQALLSQAKQKITRPEDAATLQTLQEDLTAYGAAFEEIADLLAQRAQIRSEVLSAQENTVNFKLAALRITSDFNNAPGLYLALGNVQNRFLNIRLDVLNYISTGQYRFAVVFDLDYQEMQDELSEFNRVLTTPEQQQLSADIQAALGTYAQGFKSIQFRQSRLKELQQGQLAALESEMSQAAFDIAAQARQEFQNKNVTTNTFVTQTQIVLLSAILSAIVIGLWLGWVISRRITTPLRQVAQTAQQIANVDIQAISSELVSLSQGKLALDVNLTAAPLHVTSQDEVGQTGQAFNQIIFSLHVAEQSFRHMTTYLNEMASAAQSVAQGNLGVNVDVRSPEDVLGNALAHMVANLRDAETQLRQYQEHLEELVEERTAALHESERTLATLIGNLPGMAYRCKNDPAWTMEFLSEGCTSLTGYLPTALINNAKLAYADLIHPDDRQYVWGKVQAAVQARRSFQLTYRITTSDGQEKWMWEQGQGVFDLQGELLVLEGFITNITDRVHAEEKLQEAKALAEDERNFAESLIETAQVVVLVLDTEGRIVRFNPYMEEISGYHQEEVQGKDWFTTFLPKRDQSGVRELFLGAVSDIQTRGTVNPIVMKDGREREIEWYDKVLRDVDGNIVGLLATGQDITERKRAEEALLAAAQQWRTTFDAINDMVCLMDVEGRILRCNMAMKELVGKPFDEIIGRTCWKLVCGTSERPAGCPAVRMWETCRRETQVLPIGDRWFEIAADPLLDEDGNITGAVHIMSDITERKRTEEALQESEERYKDLVEKAGIAILMDDREGGFKYFNETFLELVGYSAEEMKEQSIQSLVHPDDAGKVMQFHKNRIQGKMAPSRYEFRAIRKDRSVVYLEVDVAAVKEGESIIGTRSYMWDISERKQVEEALQASEGRYRTLVELAPDIIYQLDADGKIVFISRGIETLAYTPDELIGRSFEEIVHPDDVKKTQAGFVERRVGDRATRDAEIHLVARQGELREHAVKEVAITARGLWDVPDDRIDQADKTFLGTTGIARDITERKRAEEELRQHRDHLEELVAQRTQRLRDLTARLAEVEEAERRQLARELHDQVGQNLTALSFNLKALQTQIPAFVDRPQEIVDQSSARLDDSLALVKETTRRIRDVMDNLRPPALEEYGLTAALRWYGTVIASRTNIPVTVHGKEPTPRLAPAIETALFRVVQEALANVANHARATEAQVTLDTAQGRVRMVVADNGVGFDPERLHQPAERQRWGLLLMAERAEAVGGHCRVESATGEGTQVIVEVEL